MNRKRKPSVRLLRAREEHKQFLFSMGINGKKVKRDDMMPGPLLCQRPNAMKPVLSNDIPGAGGYKRSIDDHSWRKDSAEPAHVVKEIEAKKLRIAPAFNKGAYQYVVSEKDIPTLGRKI